MTEMVFVQRDEQGVINGIYAYICEGVAEEALPDDSPEIVAFLNPQSSLEGVKSKLKADVDASAEAARLKYITPGAGQAMTYQQKTEEARRYIATESPALSDFPMISAEVGITADTPAGVCAVILDAYAQWQQLGAAFEAIRLGAKKAIDAAETVADAQAVADALVWP